MLLKEKFKKFLKSKTGNMAVLAIIIVPFALFLFTSMSSTTRRANSQKSETLISLDSFSDYVNENYGKIIKGQNGNYCTYNQEAQTTIENLFPSYFKSIDGYNDFWEYEMNFPTDDNFSTSIEIICDIYFPKISQSAEMINHWGQYVNGVAIGGGWYSNHQKSMKELYEHFEKEKSNGYWEYKEIRVTSSCV